MSNKLCKSEANAKRRLDELRTTKDKLGNLRDVLANKQAAQRSAEKSLEKLQEEYSELMCKWKDMKDDYMDSMEALHVSFSG